MPTLFRDDNQNSLSDPSGLVPAFAASSTFGATTGAATAEVVISGAPASFTGELKRIMVRIATGANDAYYAFGAAGAAGSFTSANMTYLPQRWVEYVCIDPTTAKSFYHLQVTAAGAIQVTLLGNE